MRAPIDTIVGYGRCKRAIYRHKNRRKDHQNMENTEITMTATTEQFALGKQKIVEDLNVLLTDSEEMLRLVGQLPGEGVDALRDRLRAHVDTLQAALADAQVAAQRGYRSATVQTERYVRQNPWQALGLAAAAGFVLGVLVAR
jgi:ElaB/YqjD/DUF883 family membrane-anchored ribosome-binding protein